jgi:hypothetical protein
VEGNAAAINASFHCAARAIVVTLDFYSIFTSG